MPKLTSDLTNKTYPSSQFRELEVSDESRSTNSPIDFEAIDAERIARGLTALDMATKRAMMASMMQEQPKQRTFTSTQPVEEVSAVHKLSEFENKVAEARRQKLQGSERLNMAAKHRIESLCGISRATVEVDIDGKIYILRTLKGKEMRAAIVAAAEFDGTAHAAFEVRKQLLARSIVQVDGADLDLFLGDDSVEAKLEFVDEIEEPALIKLYAEYLDMVQDTQNRYFIKTEGEAKEVLEDLKK